MAKQPVAPQGQRPEPEQFIQQHHSPPAKPARQAQGVAERLQNVQESFWDIAANILPQAGRQQPTPASPGGQRQRDSTPKDGPAYDVNSSSEASSSPKSAHIRRFDSPPKQLKVN
eukprot:scaffold20721_cov36-Prasinocladus_malaysianus.AAC.1